jgi:hypothetical protein
MLPSDTTAKLLDPDERKAQAVWTRQREKRKTDPQDGSEEPMSSGNWPHRWGR